MTRPLQVLRAYSATEIRATPHAEALHVEYILLPGKGRYLWHPESSEADDGVKVLALEDAGGCRCCGGRGRFKLWEVAAGGGSGGGGGGVTDHGALDGLADDDHPQYTTAAEAAAIADAAVGAHEAALDPHAQYIRADGTRAFTGPQSMGSEKLTDLGAPTNPNDAARLADVTDQRTTWGDVLLLS